MKPYLVSKLALGILLVLSKSYSLDSDKTLIDVECRKIGPLGISTKSTNDLLGYRNVFVKRITEYTDTSLNLIFSNSNNDFVSVCIDGGQRFKDSRGKMITNRSIYTGSRIYKTETGLGVGSKIFEFAKLYSLSRNGDWSCDEGATRCALIFGEEYDKYHFALQISMSEINPNINWVMKKLSDFSNCVVLSISLLP